MNTVLSVLFHVPVEAIDVSQHFHNSWKHAQISIQKYRTFKVHNWRKKLIRKKPVCQSKIFLKYFTFQIDLSNFFELKWDKYLPVAAVVQRAESTTISDS